MPSLDFSQTDGEDPAPIPKGIYEIEIHHSDFRVTRSGGEQLIIGSDIMTAPYAGRRIFSAINYAGYTEGALKFGKKQLAKILKALGIPKISGTEELHDKPLMATIGIEYSDDKNTIDGWHPFDAEISRAAATAPAAQAAPATEPSALKEQARRRFLSNGNSAKPTEPEQKRTTQEICGEDIPF